MDHSEIRNALIDKGLKVTPQRMAVLEAVIRLDNHPTADQVLEFIKVHHPNVALGTVYNILETFVQHELVKKVKTDRDAMRYDAIMEKHHHLYCYESDRIEDYFDEDLNRILAEYFTRKDIPEFNIKDIKLQIIGNFTKPKKNQYERKKY